MPAALFLSPHLDDVAFSCGGTAARLARAGWRVVVATVFAESVSNPTGFALACQLDKGLAGDVDYMAVRRAEDLASCAALGVAGAYHYRGFPEAPHRGYESAAELFAGVKPGDDVWRPVADALRGDVAAADVVFAPQGLGNHADHLQLIRAVLEILPADRVTWYRDTPYAVRDPGARPAPGVPDGPEIAVDVPDTLEAKLAACAAFATQLGFQFGGEAAMRSTLVEFAHAEARAAGRTGAAERFVGSHPLPAAAGRG